MFRLQASLDGFFHVSCTSLDREGTTTLLQADAGEDDVKTKSTTNVIAAAREKTIEEAAAAKDDIMG